MALGAPTVVAEFDPNGPNEDYPEQPEDYGESILVPTYFGVYTVDPATGDVTLFSGTTTRDPGALHDDGTFLQGLGKFSADGSSYNASYLQTSGGPGGWSNGSADCDDIAVDHFGRIWGADNQRPIWCWNSDGTIYREFNTFIAPGPTVPDGPRGFYWHDGLMYLASYDGIWVTDPYDAANVVDLWPERSPADYPGEYELHFTRLVNVNDFGPADPYMGGITVYDGRVFWVDTGERPGVDSPSRIMSCELTGTDQTPTVEFDGADYPGPWADASPAYTLSQAYSLTGLNVIGGKLYASAWAACRLLRWDVGLDVPTLAVPGLHIPYRTIRRRQGTVPR